MLHNALLIQSDLQKVIPSFQIGTFWRGQQKIPALIPADKGMVFYVEENNKNLIYNQIQYSLLTVLQQLEIGAIEITILDFTIERTFDWLLNLASVLPIEKISDIKDFDAQIERLRQMAIDTNHDFLMKNQVETLADYNSSVEYREPYQIVILTDHWRKAHFFNHAQALKELLEMGYKAGIYFICVLNQAEIKAEKAAAQQRSYQHHAPKEMELLTDAISKNLIGIETLPNRKVRFSNIQQAAFYRITQSFLFEYSQYPIHQVQEVMERLVQKSAQKQVQMVNCLSVPIGRVGNKPVFFEMGDKQGIFNGFIAGAVGTGKSNLLQHLILTIAENYSPDEFHFLIMDYKNGNDFNTFKKLLHLELLLLDNSRLDAAVQVVQAFLQEQTRRGHLFNALSNQLGIPIQNIDAYNKHAPFRLHRKLLIIDEIHELFFGSWKQNKQFKDTFQLIVRQGRAYGLHIIMCTQNLEGFDLGDGIMQQIKLRLAFQLASETECRHVLSADNTLPLDLQRFEAVLNTNYGRFDRKNNGKKDNTIFKTIAVGDIPARIQAIREKWIKSRYKLFEKTIIEPQPDANANPIETRLPSPKKRDENDFDMGGNLWD